MRRTADNRNAYRRRRRSNVRRGLLDRNTGRLTPAGQHRCCDVATSHTQVPSTNTQAAAPPPKINNVSATSPASPASASNCSRLTVPAGPSVHCLSHSSLGSSNTLSIAERKDSPAPRTLRTMPRNWNAENLHGSVHLANQLQEDLQEALQASAPFLAIVCAASHAQAPFWFVLGEIDRVTHAVATAAYLTGHRKAAQASTPNRHRWPHE